MNTLRGNWNYPTAIRFGAGRIAELPDACRSLGMKRPLLVTDPGLARLPMVASAMQSCRDAGLHCETSSRSCRRTRSRPTSRRVSMRSVAAPTMA